jgi:hypothetical protein
VGDYFFHAGLFAVLDPDFLYYKHMKKSEMAAKKEKRIV